jgi:hypothetical protein
MIRIAIQGKYKEKIIEEKIVEYKKLGHDSNELEILLKDLTYKKIGSGTPKKERFVKKA